MTMYNNIIEAPYLEYVKFMKSVILYFDIENNISDMMINSALHMQLSYVLNDNQTDEYNFVA